MADITITIPNAVLSRVINALTFDYQPTLDNGTPNPTTRNQHAKQQIIKFIKNRVRTFEQETAIRNLTASVENDITIT